MRETRVIMREMAMISQAQSFGEIRIEGQGASLTINQMVQIAVAEIKTRPFVVHSPYIGLSRFEERHRDFFFGRDQLVGQLLRLVAEKSLLLVAGASGSGKSSVVRAGLLPQLAARLPQGRFRPLLMTPDRDPFLSLRSSLIASGIAQRQIERLGSDEGTLATVLAPLRPAEESWLLFVDQFEEIFTLCADSSVRVRFLNGLLNLAEQVRAEIKVVLAMRADFFDRFGPHPEFGKAAEQGVCLVMDMHAGELRAAIEQPAARHGVVFEEGLVDQIIADVRGRPGALPLLQYTLALLWRESSPADGRTLLAATYHRLGGIEGALRLRADMLYAQPTAGGAARPAEQQQALRQIFLRLVDFSSQGVDARAVSKRTRLSEFVQSVERELIAELVDEKLLVSNGRGSVHEREASIEVAHEALLSAWPLLRDWIAQAREVIYVRNRLNSDAHSWLALQASDEARAREELWSGTRLAQALELRARRDFLTVLGGLSEGEERFLDASAALRERRMQEEEQQRMALAQVEIEKREQRLRLQRVTGIILSTFLILASSAAIYARKLQQQATQRELDLLVENAREALRDHRRSDALNLLSDAQGRGSHHPDIPFLLTQALDTHLRRVLAHPDKVSSARFSPDGRDVLTTCRDGKVRIFASASGRLVHELASEKATKEFADYSPDGSKVVTLDKDGTAHLYESETGALLHVFSHPDQRIEQVRFANKGNYLLTSNWRQNRQLRIWELRDHHLVRELKGVALSDSGRYDNPDADSVLLVATHGKPVLLSLRDDFASSPLHSLLPNDSIRDRYLISRSELLIESSDQSLAAIRLKAPHERHEIALSSRLVELEVSRSGELIFALLSGGRAEAIDTRTWRTRFTVQGYRGPLLASAFSPDQRLVATTGSDGTVWLWETIAGRLQTTLEGHRGAILAVGFNPSGKQLITAGADKTARIWDTDSVLLQTGLVSAALPEPDKFSISTSGAYAVTGRNGVPGVLSVHRIEDGKVLSVIGGLNQPSLVSLDPVSNKVASVDASRRIRLAGLTDGKVQPWISTGWSDVARISLTPGAQQLIAVTRGGRSGVWNTQDGDPISLMQEQSVSYDSRYRISYPRSHSEALILAFLKEQTDRGYSLRAMPYLFSGPNLDTFFPILRTEGPFSTAAYAADGNMRLFAFDDILVTDRSGKLLATLTGHTRVTSIESSPDGGRVVSASRDHTARVWALPPGKGSVLLAGHQGPITSAVFGPSGERILTTSDDQTARLWEAASGKQLMVLSGHQGVVALGFFLPDRERVLTVDVRGICRVWDFSLTRSLQLEDPRKLHARLASWLACQRGEGQHRDCVPEPFFSKPPLEPTPDELLELARVAQKSGALDEAARLYSSAEAGFLALNDQAGIAELLLSQIEVAARQEDPATMRPILKRYSEHVLRLSGGDKLALAQFLAPKSVDALRERRVPIALEYCVPLMRLGADAGDGVSSDCLEVRLAAAQFDGVLRDAQEAFARADRPGLKAAVAAMAWAAALFSGESAAQGVWRRRLEENFVAVTLGKSLGFNFEHSRPILSSLQPAPLRLLDALVVLELLEKKKTAQSEEQLKLALDVVERKKHKKERTRR